MGLIPVLIGVPAVIAVLLSLIRSEKVRGIVVYAGAGGVMVLTLGLLFSWIQNGCEVQSLYVNTELVDHLMMIGEAFLMCLIVFLSIKHRKILPAILSVAQTGLLFYVELTADLPEAEHMTVDRLALLMCVIIAFVGGFICIYAVGYMKGYKSDRSHVVL